MLSNNDIYQDFLFFFFFYSIQRTGLTNVLAAKLYKQTYPLDFLWKAIIFVKKNDLVSESIVRGDK